jgi:hypothetical protein
MLPNTAGHDALSGRDAARQTRATTELEKSGHNPFATRSHTPPLPHSLTRTLGVGSNILKRCVFGTGFAAIASQR